MQLKNLNLQEKFSLPGKDFDNLVTAPSWNTTDVSERKKQKMSQI